MNGQYCLPLEDTVGTASVDDGLFQITSKILIDLVVYVFCIVVLCCGVASNGFSVTVPGTRKTTLVTMVLCHNKKGS